MEVTLVATDQDSKKKIRSEAIVVIPAHNEERFIGSVVLKARKYADAVLVVDDGSTDATAEIAEAAGAMVVQHARNRGKGVALTTGFRSALGLDPAAVITLDGDFQHLPEEMPAIVGPVLDGSADIVVGSRYLANLSAVPLHRIWGHRAFTLLTNLLSGVGVTDSQSGFRAFSRRAIEAISFQSEGFSVESEMQFLAQEHNLRMVEVPVTIRYPDKPKRPVWAHGLHVLNGVLRLVGRYRPLLFFGVPGMLALLAGLLGFSIGLSTFVALMISEPTVRSLRRLIEAARNISSGQLDSRVPVESVDEVGELAQAFNSMAQQLETSIAKERDLTQARR